MRAALRASLIRQINASAANARSMCHTCPPSRRTLPLAPPSAPLPERIAPYTFPPPQIGYWDMRKGNSPIDLTPVDVCHRDPVYDLAWLQSKTGTEFMTTSTDGMVMWWDLRKMSEPQETLPLKVRAAQHCKLFTNFMPWTSFAQTPWVAAMPHPPPGPSFRVPSFEQPTNNA